MLTTHYTRFFCLVKNSRFSEPKTLCRCICKFQSSPRLATTEKRRNSSIANSNPSTSKVIDVSEACKALFERSLIERTFPSSLQDEWNRIENFPPVVYAGFDPTSDSLHIGSLLILNSLLHLYREGFKVIILIGSATARLGDPSGRTDERNALNEETISSNTSALRTQIEDIFRNFKENIIGHGKKSIQFQDPLILDNYDWYKEISVVDFYGSVGRKFRIGTMLAHAAVKGRLDSELGGINYSEFSYQIFQSLDWVKLYQDFDCRLQIGGRDQTANIQSGKNLLRKEYDRDACGLMSPLLTSPEGEKFGKSMGAPVWLNPQRTSPYQLYQYFVTLPDSQLHNHLRLFTFLSLKNIEKIVTDHKRAPYKMSGQKTLAASVVTLIHGKAGLERASKCTDILFGGDAGLLENLRDLTVEEAQEIFKDVPTVTLDFYPSISLLDVTIAAGCFRSENEAVKIISAGGVSVNGVRISEPKAILVPGSHIHPVLGITVLRVGKRRHYLVKYN